MFHKATAVFVVLAKSFCHVKDQVHINPWTS